MTALGDGFKSIFLAGIGAMAYTGEKGKEIVDALVEKGELTVDQGKQVSQELQAKADEASRNIREAALEATLKGLSPEDRLAFAAKATEFAEQLNARQAEAEAEAQSEEVELDEAIDAAIAETGAAAEAAVAAAEEATEAAVGIAQEALAAAEEAAAQVAEAVEAAAEPAED